MTNCSWSLRPQKIINTRVDETGRVEREASSPSESKSRTRGNLGAGFGVWGLGFGVWGFGV